MHDFRGQRRRLSVTEILALWCLSVGWVVVPPRPLSVEAFSAVKPFAAQTRMHQSFVPAQTSPTRHHLSVTALSVKEPAQRIPPSNHNHRRVAKKRSHNGRPWPLRSTPRRKREVIDPVAIETAVHAALDVLRVQAAAIASSSWSPPTTTTALLFPSVRDCNAALSAFGDQGDLLRALRLFGKMRKTVDLQQRIQRATGWHCPVPGPTLVTYSTLMSRAVRAHKPHVALRLWHLRPATTPVDVKALNILMNCYAKLSNVKAAQRVLQEMMDGEVGGIDGMVIQPNLVTFNTVLKACQRAGDLDAALHIKSLMDDEYAEDPSLEPDTRTYTTLLATVALRSSKSAGRRDPTVATQLLQEMHQRGIRPNGRTYSAFIEACGRCGRPDLALQGLRLMQRQKERERQARIDEEGYDRDEPYILDEEVGAWTSAIHVCGKAGRWETSVRLFGSMKKLGCAPNTVTCGCLMDLLLRCGRTAETLGVLRYMKKEGIRPTDVMYTSLMSRADRLVEMENELLATTTTATVQDDTTFVVEESNTKAIEVYTELMMSLMEADVKSTPAPNAVVGGYGETRRRAPTSFDSNTLLLKVFLVFQQMKAAGAQPDLACYNVLLRACARAGDVTRGWDVIRQMQAASLEPNDRSWRELLRTAATARQADMAETIWKTGLHYFSHAKQVRSAFRLVDEPERQWKPSMQSLLGLWTAYIREADVCDNPSRQRHLYDRVVQSYSDILMQDRHLGMQRIDPMEMLDDRRIILTLLYALVALWPLVQDDDTRLAELHDTGSSLLELECLRDEPPLSPSSQKLVETMQGWKLPD